MKYIQTKNTVKYNTTIFGEGKDVLVRLTPELVTFTDSNVNFNLKVEVVNGENIFQVTLPDQRGSRVLPEIVSVPLTAISTLTLSDINSTTCEIVLANAIKLAGIEVSEFEIV